MTSRIRTAALTSLVAAMALLAPAAALAQSGIHISLAGPATAGQGDSITYTITYGNSGSTNWGGVVVSAPVPVGTSFVSATGGGTLSGSTVRWSVGFFPPGPDATVTYTVTATSAGTVLNSTTNLNDGDGGVYTAPSVTTVVSAPGFTVSFVTDGKPGTSVSGETTQTVASGGSTSAVTAVPSSTTYFMEWGAEGGGNYTTANPLVLTNVTASVTMIAYFRNKGATTTTVTTSGSPSTYGGAVTYTATVAGSGATPTGTVTFTFDSGSTLCSAVALSGGVATCTPSSLDAGNHLVTASYSGEEQYLPSSGSVAQSVNQAPATVSFVSSANPSVFGQSVTWSITVTGVAGGAAPTGSATLHEPSLAVASGTLDGAGHLTLSRSSLAVGDHVLAVQYAGDGNYLLADSSDLTQRVGRGATTVGATASPSPAEYGQTVTISVTATPTAPASGAPTGTFVISEGGVEVCSGTLASGAGACTTSSLALGTHVLDVAYAGDGSFTLSTGTVVLEVGKATPTVVLASSRNPSTMGQVVTFTATVTGAAGTPGGTVTFRDGGVDLAGCAGVALSSGVATCTPALGAGTHTIQVAYSGDADHLTGSGSVSQVVAQASTTVALVSSNDFEDGGRPITLTATVSAVAPGSGSPTGTVTFLRDGVAVGTGTLSGGVATLTGWTPAGGTYGVTASYAGTDDYAASTSAQIVQQVLGVFPITESFRDGTAPGWTLLGNASLTSGGADPAGGGWLRLTAAWNNQAGSALYAPPFPSSKGIVVEFDYAMYGGSGADGFSFYLVDGATLVPTLGSAGGGLGYTSSTWACGQAFLTPGVTNGYVGIGFDQYGNFSNCRSGTGGPGITPNVIAIRGSGDRLAAGGFTYLSGTHLAQGVATGSRAGARRVRISIVDRKIKVEMKVGESYTTVVDQVDLATATGQAAMPRSFKMGFSGSTGGATNFHEIRNLNVVTPANLTVTNVASPTSARVGDTVTWTVTVANTLDPVAGTGLTLAVPAGITNLGWSAVTAGGATISSPGGTGPIAETMDLPKDGSVTLTVTGTVDVSAAGTTVRSTAAILLPTNVSNLGNDSATAAVSIARLASSVAVASDANPSSFGAPVTYTAAVSGAGPTPTGTVSFVDGAAALCGPVALVGGVASCAVTAPGVGAHEITATYAGDPVYLPSTGSVSQVVDRAATSVALDAPATTTHGTMITLTAAVGVTPPGAGSPTGTVAFRAAGALLPGCEAVALSGGVAYCSTPLVPVGAPTALTATYSGDDDFAGSSAGRAIAVGRGAAYFELISSSPRPSTYGQPVTFSVLVVAAGVVPTGTFTFSEGGVEVCSGVLSSAGDGGCASSALAVGTHVLTVTYSGDTSYLLATGAHSHAVNQALTSTAVATSGSPATYGQAITYSARVTGPGGTPTGAVTFTSDTGVVLCSAVPLSAGVASCTPASLDTGNHLVTASYAGEERYLSSSGTVSQAVDPARPTVTLASSANPSVWGQRVTLAVTVAGVTGGATPDGAVTLREGGTLVGQGALDGAGHFGVATASLGVGSHVLAVEYAGNRNYVPASADLSQVVGQAATTTALVASPSPSVSGEGVTLTATASPTAPGAGTLTGTVTFRDGVAVLGTASLSGGVATLSTAALAAASHALSATYSGDGNFTGSAGAFTLVIGRGAAAVAVTAGPSPSMYGQPVTVSVSVTAVAPASGVPSGTCTVADGATTLGTVTLDGSGRGVLTTSSLAAGSHPLVVAYAGDTSFAPSSGSATHPVEPGSASLVVESSRPVSRRGRPIVFTVRVTSPHATPIGVVTLRSGDAVLGTGAVDEDGVARITVRALAKRATPWPITAEFAGGANFVAGTAELAGGQAVENTPPVAGSGSALAFGLDAAGVATVHVAGAFDLAEASFEAWVHPGWLTSAAAPSASPTVLSLESGGVPRLALGVQPDRAAFTVAVAGASYAFPAPLDDGTWHHVALVHDAAGVRVFVDGALTGVAAAAPTGAGADLVLGGGFVGLLDEVRVWSAARTAPGLLADLRRPLRGDEATLAGYWRMDEGSGVELFDASAGAHDGAVAALTSTAQPFAASSAWRHRVVPQERPMAPADAGYDADGDPLTLAISAPPAHGTATVDGTALQAGYRPAAGFLGADTFTFTLDDGSGAIPYALEPDVTRILVCQADADCGGGDVCVRSLCVAPSRLSASSGSGGMGCSAGGSGAASLALLGLALLRLRPRRRPALLALAVASLAGGAQAQTPGAFGVQTYDPAPAGDRFFAVPDARVEGHLTPAASLTGSWAAEPLVLRRDGAALPGGHLVHRQSWGFAGVSLPVSELLLLDASMPVAFYQSGTRPFANVSQVSSAGAGDLRLGARAALPLALPVGLALGADVWLPTGSRGAYASDGKLQAEPRVIASCDLGRVACGASLGFLLRPRQDFGYTAVGNALTFTAGAGVRLGRWLVGPELYGRAQLVAPNDAPLQALLGAQWSRGSWSAGLGVGTAFDRSAGAAPERVVARVAWQPAGARRDEALARAAALRQEAAEREQAERRAAEQAVADRAAAARAEAERLAAKADVERSAAQRAEAERIAAAKAEADRAAADRDGDGIPDLLDACPEQRGVASSDPAKHGCPAVRAVVVKADRLEILEPILFEVDRDVLRPESVPVLKEVAAVLIGHPGVRVLVEGHTDSHGDAAHNTTLSQKRARAVKRWLVEEGGIGETRLEARGFGPTKPIASNTTSEGRAKNRRVVFTILGP